MALEHRNLKASAHKNDLKVLAGLLVVLGIGIVLFLREYNTSRVVHSFETTKAVYECPDTKSITAAFSGNIVNLELSDGRNMVLNHSFQSTYANGDKSMTFWTRGKMASVREGDVVTYENCEKR
jgi:membrane-bound inhibitor of C-type lysozyme